MRGNESLASATLLSMLNGLDVFVYATDPEDDTILFINDSMKQHYNLEGDVVGQYCYKLLQEDMDARCDFCPCHQLEKNPEQAVFWVEHSPLTKRSYRNTDRFIEGADGKRIHIHHSVDITSLLKRDKMMQAVNAAASLLLAPGNDGDIDKPLVAGMELIGLSINADRVHIWQNQDIDGELFYVYMHGWFKDEDDPQKPFFNGLKLSVHRFPEWHGRFMRGEIVGGPLSSLPQVEHDFFNEHNTKAVIILPLFLNDAFWGFFSVDNCVEEREYETEEISILRSISLMMANAINQNALIHKMNEAHERSMLMLDTSPICAQIWDRDLNTIDCNEAGVKLYGFKNKQDYTDRFLSSCSPEFQPDGQRSDHKAVALVNKAFEEGICRFDWMHKMPDDDTLIPADITLVRSKYKDKDIVIGYTTDMREHNALLQKLNAESRKFEETAHWYKSILDAIPHAISVTDKNMNWTFGNKVLCAYVGIDFDNMMGVPCSAVGKPICKTDGCAIVRAKQGIRQTFFERGGSSFQTDVEILKDLEGEISGFIEVVQNITHVRELMQQRTQAETASQTKSSFLASMSHEIRTPMNAILGVTEILMDNGSLTPEVREGLIKIFNSCNLLLGIINDILDFSKIEAGKLEILPAPYSTAGLISDSAHLNAMRIESKPILFEVLPDEHIPAKLVGDELRIKQILNNVLSNAFKYTDAGSVTFEARTEPIPGGVNLIFCVRDTGIGMTDRQLQKLFGEYTRFVEGHGRGVEGTGLGLAITRRLLQLMDGDIQVESVYGQGSRFTVTLPQKTAEDTPIGPEVAQSIRQFRMVQMGQKQKSQVVREPMPYGSILIVDDLEPNLYVAQGLMKPYRLHIETAMSGYSAVKKISEGNVYDVIFMDHMMPDMDGIEATLQLRKMGYTAPIVALTANAITGQADLFVQNGFDEFISKPIDTRHLNQILNKFVRDKQPPEVIEAARRQIDAPVAQSGKNSPLINILCTNKKLDVYNALVALGGMQEVYENTVKLSARLMPGSIQKMDAFLATGDLKNFAIEVHGLKGVARSIGATEIAATASRLEIAALNNGREFCKSTYPAFKATVMDFAQQLSQAINQVPAAKKEEINPRDVLEKIKIAKQIAEGYDATGALEHMKPLIHTSFNEEAELLLEEVVFNLEEFNCIGAIEGMEKVEAILSTE
ncbi:MAG: ATP-binding protein [Defluviitaleaceae bacterium]|nr:ATP-binding protein [Defluviitaleaceae bacterium]MCL2240424.1 ATP-binding protein [Defluviitaleaceae bacterium]